MEPVFSDWSPTKSTDTINWPTPNSRNETPMSTRLVLFSACLLGFSPGLPGQEEQAPATPDPLRVTDADLRQARSPQATRDILPILRRYCTGCHGPETSEGGLQLETALNRKPLVRDRDTWNNIAFLVGHRFMPPEDEEQPDDATRRRLVAWIRVPVSYTHLTLPTILLV